MKFTVQLAPAASVSAPASRAKLLVPLKDALAVQLPAVTVGPVVMLSVGEPAAKVLARLSLSCTLGAFTVPVLPTVSV